MRYREAQKKAKEFKDRSHKKMKDNARVQDVEILSFGTDVSGCDWLEVSMFVPEEVLAFADTNLLERWYMWNIEPEGGCEYNTYIIDNYVTRSILCALVDDDKLDRKCVLSQSQAKLLCMLDAMWH